MHLHIMHVCLRSCGQMVVGDADSVWQAPRLQYALTLWKGACSDRTDLH